MARTPDANFQSFLVRTALKTPLTTEQLYSLAKSRNFTLTRSRVRDVSRPSQYAWQHQLRRDQFTLMNAGFISRTSNGTWVTTAAKAARFFGN